MNCPTCDGSGYLETEQVVQVMVPVDGAGSPGKMTYPVSTRCPDCELWAVIQPFIQFTCVSKIDIEGRHDPNSVVAIAARKGESDNPEDIAVKFHLTIKHFKVLKEYVEKTLGKKIMLEADL